MSVGLSVSIELGFRITDFHEISSEFFETLSRKFKIPLRMAGILHEDL